MPIVQVEARLSTDELLKAIAQLSQIEFEQFSFQIIALRAQRQAPSLPQDEANLLIKINQGVPPKVQERYNELVDKRRAESLMSDEYDELLRLTNQVENLEARRVKYLAELARLRGLALTELMKNLGIGSPAYV